MKTDSEVMTNIGSRLKEVRHTLVGTLRDMSKICGIPISTLSEMEMGRNKPNTAYLLLLSAKYRINLNWVFTGEGGMILPEFELKFDFGKDSKLILEMIYLIENFDMVRYDMISHYLLIKDKLEDKIEKYLPVKEEDD